MKREIASKWIEALRSDEFSQCREALKDNYGYCCLGVLCEISNLSEWVPDIIGESNPNLEYLGQNGVLPPEVQSWAGMRSDNGRIVSPEFAQGVAALSELNDEGKTFLELAGLIEKHQDTL